ncbi:MAG: glycosyltransferase [Planctomycetes bacterium]|nr:glycosyltransferase [Planctomycetota bacterium]
MRVLALVEAHDGASARLRVARWLPWLREHGVDVALEEIVRSGPRRWLQLGRAARFDAVWLQRRLLQPWESAWLRRCSRRLVVDLDDAVWRRDHAPFRSRGRSWRARALFRRADVVVAGAATLARELEELGVRAVVLPTPLDGGAVASAPPRSFAPTPTLAWIGQPSTWRYVAPVVRAWPAIRAALPTARFVAMGSAAAEAGSSAPDRGDGDGIERRTWSPDAEAELLREAWLGLAPLPDDPWTRGKCGARLLSYLAAGLPAVASRVGAQAELADEFGGESSGAHGSLRDWPSDGALASTLVDALTAEGARPSAERSAIAHARAAQVAARRALERLGPRLLAALVGDSAGADGVAATRPAR